MNRDTIRIERVAFHAILLFLFCFFVQLLGFPNKFALLGSFSICAGHVYKEKNIQVGYRECLLLLGMFFYAYISGCEIGKDGKPLDVGMDIFHRGLCLPSDNKMTVDEQNVVIEIVQRCFK